MYRTSRHSVFGPMLVAVLAFAGSAPGWAVPVQATFGPAAHCAAQRDSFQNVGGLWGIAGSCNFNIGDLAYFGNSRLVLQSDGNLVIYAIDSGQAAWSTNSQGLTSAYTMRFQVDGNLVIYNASGGPTWSTNTWGVCNGPDNQKWLAFQDDGNLVLYCRTSTGVTQKLYSSNTWMH